MLQHFDHKVKLHYILASDGCNITDGRGRRLRRAENVSQGCENQEKLMVSK